MMEIEALSKRVRSTLCLPSRLDYIEPLQSYIKGLCDIHGCDGKDCSMILLAVEEAVSNVVKHGYDDEDGSYEVSFDVGPAGMAIEILEKGIPFDPDKLRSYGEEKPEGEKVGIGIRLMMGAMDRVDFLNLGKKGKLVRMYKYFRHGRIDRYLTDEELRRADLADTPVEPFTIRPLKREESVEVSRCAYRAYGYSYREFIYYPQKIWELNEKGSLRSYVLVDGEGKLLGHLGLSFSEPNSVIAEMAAAFVNPSCRGRGFLGQLTSFVMKEAVQTGLEGVYVHAVTSHNISQKGAARAGLIPSGLLLAALFPDLEFKALSGKVVQKENALLMFKMLQSKGEDKVYLPRRYYKIVQSIADDIGRDIAIEDEYPDLPKSCLGDGNSYFRVEEFNFSEIRIRSFSEGALLELKARLHGFLQDQVDVVYLYIDVENELAGTFAEKMRDLGFFFCGYMPGELSGRDALILQRLNERPVDFDAISLVNDKACRLAHFIKEDMPEEDL